MRHRGRTVDSESGMEPRWVGRVVRSLASLAVVIGLVAPGTHVRGQASGVLQIRVVLGDAGAAVPLPRHVLLVSDNPASRVPWRVVVAADGSGRVTLPPGNYTVESEEPLVFQGKALEWRQTLDVPSGTETLLELTAANADIGVPPPPKGEANVGPTAFDAWDVLLRAQDSIVALWTPTTHASGVVLTRTGFVATNQRVIGTAATVEVHLAPAVSVAARVLATDPARDVAILWVDPAALSARAPVASGCEVAGRTPVDRGQRVAAIGTRPGGQPYPTPGTVRRVEAGFAITAFDFPVESTGGPVFGAGDAFVGLTTAAGEPSEDVKVVRLDAICHVLEHASAKIEDTAPPSGSRLRVEASARVPDEKLEAAARRRVGSLNPYPSASSDFDIAFLTPVIAHAGLQRTMDFANWSGYVATAPPVLLVRVTPKQVEGFWTTVARGAAMTQGIALPAFKHFKPGFARMRVTCGGAEVQPIHPLIIERRISATDAVREGLYVFDLDDLGPHCGKVTIEAYSEKTPDRRDPVEVDARVLQQIAHDVREYRALQLNAADGPRDGQPRR